LIHEQ